MDKKNVFLGVALLLAGIAMMVWTSKQEAESRRQAAERAAQEQAMRPPPSETQPAEVAELGATPVRTETTLSPASEGDLVARPLEATPEADLEAQLAVLENEYLRAEFTTLGGTLQRVTLKEFAAEKNSEERVVLHGRARIRPLALAQRTLSGFTPLEMNYRLVENFGERLVYETTLRSGIVVRRIFSLVVSEENTPGNYTIQHRLELTNPSATAFNLNNIYINLGTAAPTNADPYGFDLNAGFMDDGSYDNIAASKFKGGMFSRARDQVTETGIIQWGAVKNQFFSSILTPVQPATAIIAEGVRYPQTLADKTPPLGVTAYLEFTLPTLAAGETLTLEMAYYSGPKDFKRLSQMGLDQEDVMHLGWFIFFFIGLFAFVGKMLLSLLIFLHGAIGNWGWAIIVMTIIVRLLLWPLTAKSTRAAKRMQELSKPMQELKEKYKDNPQKQQQAMMELFRKHKVNPMSGCWPVLVQFPIFIAMFNLLRNTADLRFAEFLWIGDLSMPDATIPLGTDVPFIGSAINVLPFIWLVSMWFQMKLMPQPSVDNAQMKIIKYMPFIFFPFTYLFSSGLVLYWTTTNGFSIFQGWMTRRKKDSEDIAIEAEIEENERKKNQKVSAGPLVSKKKKKKNDDPRRR